MATSSEIDIDAASQPEVGFYGNSAAPPDMLDSSEQRIRDDVDLAERGDIHAYQSTVGSHQQRSGKRF